MKKIAMLIILVAAVSVLLFGCELFRPKADVHVMSASYGSGIVTVDFKITNTGTVDIAWWEVVMSVIESDGEKKFGDWEDGPLAAGASDTVSGYLKIDVDDPPMHYVAVDWWDQDITVEDKNLEAE